MVMIYGDDEALLRLTHMLGWRYNLVDAKLTCHEIMSLQAFVMNCLFGLHVKHGDMWCMPKV